ncbi:MAG TPA: hypothetical protein VGV89_01185 [Thermoplasmata archaeon]|nr:hypothetical protein [Thermoplasmata archaeon]
MFGVSINLGILLVLAGVAVFVIVTGLSWVLKLVALALILGGAYVMAAMTFGWPIP